jgi:formate dehydrogenase maturation protein FdhE
MTEVMAEMEQMEMKVVQKQVEPLEQVEENQVVHYHQDLMVEQVEMVATTRVHILVVLVELVVEPVELYLFRVEH